MSETPQDCDLDEDGLYDNLGGGGGILEPNDLAPTSSGDGPSCSDILGVDLGSHVLEAVSHCSPIQLIKNWSFGEHLMI